MSWTQQQPLSTPGAPSFLGCAGVCRAGAVRGARQRHTPSAKYLPALPGQGSTYWFILSSERHSEALLCDCPRAPSGCSLRRCCAQSSSALESRCTCPPGTFIQAPLAQEQSDKPRISGALPDASLDSPKSPHHGGQQLLRLCPVASGLGQLTCPSPGTGCFSGLGSARNQEILSSTPPTPHFEGCRGLRRTLLSCQASF